MSVSLIRVNIIISIYTSFGRPLRILELIFYRGRKKCVQITIDHR